MSGYGVFDALEEEVVKIKESQAEDRFNDALYELDNKFGDYLRMAQTSRQFEKRWSQVSNEILTMLAERDVFPKPKVVREVKARLRPNFGRSTLSVDKAGWTYSADLRVYASEGTDPFTCPCGTTLGKIGMNVCDGCGRVWNSWRITEAGRQKVLCREVHNDRSVILARRK